MSTTESFSGNDFYSVAQHELGHLLGFGTAESFDGKIVGTNFVGANSGTVALEPLGLGHWAQGTLSTINGVGSFEVAMDPSITMGTRKNMTDLDWNGMRDLGWQVSAVPEAAPSTLLLAGLLSLGWLARRRRNGGS